MTGQEGRLLKPLRTGRALAIAGLVAVLAAQVFDPASSRLPLLLNVAGVAGATWGAVRVSTWVARLRGRRSLTETALGLFLVGGSDLLAVLAAQGPENRENRVIFMLVGAFGAVLGGALLLSAALDFRTEARRIAEPDPEPAPGAITRPQPAGTALHAVDAGFLRITLGVCATTLVVALVLVLVR
ncbi:MAG TPA: hypothetical protein VFP72_10545 [Kineosporiaceae bacterium]|nr:hypothetical protein [Kineosporiaceae bacterium]